MAKKIKTTSKVIKLDAREIRRSLDAFAANAAVFSADTPRLIDKYEHKWVGVHDGRVAATGDTLTKLADKINKLGIPTGETMIRRIDRDEKTMIL